MADATYELTELLGTGGMGSVYRATHHPTGREVAIKLLHPDVRADPTISRLFHDEATAAAKIDDPRVVRLLDLGHDAEGFPYLVMELAEGPSILDLIDRWAGWRPIAAALVGTLEGLAAAHGVGVIHRDMKPSNVFLEPETGSARILDFGVAAMLDPLRGEDRSIVVGTPEYMPPEQLLGKGPYGPWTDLYAVGVMLSQIVRGRSPFANATSMQSLLIAKADHTPTDAPSREGLRVPEALDALIEELLRPNPRERPRFSADVARRLRALADDVIDRVPPHAVGIFESADSTDRTTVDPNRPSAPPPPTLSLPLTISAPADVGIGAALARLREPPLVGREAEREELRALVEEVRETSAPRVIAYLGEAGIGKSRLARWGLAHIEREGRMEGASGGYEMSGADLSGGLRYALRRLIGLPTPGWTESWASLADEPGLDLEQLRVFLEPSRDSDAFPVDVAVPLAHATLRAVCRAHPVYLWLDDLAWARDGAIELVHRVLEEGALPILMVITLRRGAAQASAVKETMQAILAHPSARIRPLAELDREGRAALLAATVPLSDGLATRLADRLDGSPLLLEQLVRDWLDRGLLEPDGAVVRPRAGASVDELLLERPLSAILADRLDALFAAFGERREAAEAVLGRAALLGGRFEHVTLEGACARDPALSGAMDEVLDRALLLGLVRSEGRAVYGFDHGMLREAMLERTRAGSDERAALVDAANGMMARYGKQRADVASRVAGLLWRAGDRDRAWERQLRAIGRAAWQGDDFVAQGYLSTARAWAREDPSKVAAIELAEARVHYHAVRYDRALEHVRRAREADADEAGLDAAMLEANVLFYQDRLRESEALAREAYERADGESPDEKRQAHAAAHRLADLAVLRNDFEAAYAWHVRSMELAMDAGQLFRVRVARLNAAETKAALGDLAGALEMVVECEREARAERDDAGLVAARETRIRLDVLAGRLDRAREPLSRRVAECRGGDPWRLSSFLVFAALVAVVDRDPKIGRVIAELLERYAAVPHEEAITLRAARLLAERLEDAGHFQLARKIDAMLEARAEAHARGFAPA